MMERDPLTQAFSREALQRSLPAELERASADNMPVSLCMLDLDYFKSINDAYGHLRGDEVLQELGGRLTARLRAQDRLYRYGGDEFVVLLPGTGLADAVAVAQRLRSAVVVAPFDGSPPLWLSISVGAASYPVDASTAQLLFEEADQRLYQAKRGGRNQVVGDAGPASDALLEDSPTRLIERDDALARIHGFLGNVATRGRGIIAITGPVGSGRTQLLTMTSQAARLRGYAVLTVERGLEDLPRNQGGMPSGDLDVLIAAFGTLRPGTGKLGTMIALDDLDTYPDESVERLVAMVRSTMLPSVALAYTAANPLPGARVGDDAVNEIINLTPLSPTGVRIWLRELLRGEPPGDFLDWVYEESRGLPAQVQRLLTGLIARGALHPASTGGWRLSDTTNLPFRSTVSTAKQHNLPNLLTEVVGREDEIREVRALLATQRLVTLVGPGGIGKTRLALQAARASVADFADGVWFVPLGSIEDPELVVPTLAQALGVMEVPDQPLLDRLKETLATQERLLLLDNFEQIVEAAPVVSDLLQAAPRLRALVTSRERLRIYGEHIYPVPPLALPDLTRLPGLDEMARAEAVALFIARARAIDPNFTLDGANADAVVEICARLDGLPLAIELAAARADEFTIAEMRQQLADIPALLTGGPRDLPRRQQTLRAAVDWSVDRLSPEEQRLFAQLSVFAGGCSFEIASEVVEPATSTDKLARRLDRLVEKHLIQRLGDRETPRFGMLETIRAFGLERLQRGGWLATTQERHARAFLSLAERAESELRYGNQGVWLDRLETEHINLRAALRWALDHDRNEIAGRLGAAIWRFWSVRNHVTEGRRWLAELRERGELVPAMSRVHLLIGSGVMAWIQGEYDAADAHFHASLDLSADDASLPARAMALNNLGLVARQRANYDNARRFFEASLDSWRRLGDVWGTANVLGNLARMAQQQGDVARARELAAESITLRSGISDRYGLALALHTLGLAELDRGDYTRAGQVFNESLQHATELNDPRLIAMTLTGLGRLAQIQQRWPETRQNYLEALRWWQELEHKEGVAESLEGVASALGAMDDPITAACLFGAADRLRRRVGAPVPPSARARHERILDATRSQMSEETWNAAWLKGTELTLNSAIATARSILQPA